MTSSSKTEFDPQVAAGLHAKAGNLFEGSHDGSDVSIVFVWGRFNGGITSRRLEGALAAAEESGIGRASIAHLVFAWSAFQNWASFRNESTRIGKSDLFFRYQRGR